MLMQEVLVRQSNGDYRHVEFYDDSTVDCLPISDEEAHDWDCGTYLVYSINSAFTSWVLIIGENYDVVFYGSNAQGSVLALGDLASMNTWVRNLTVPKSHTVVNWFAPPTCFGALLRASEFSDSLHFLQAEGVFPQLPLDMTLTPVVVDGVLYRSYRPW